MINIPNEQNTCPDIQTETLVQAVSKLLDTPVQHARYEAVRLYGGTLGDVRLLSGDADTGDGKHIPFRIVRKTQKQWQRPGDPHSWRREYDLAQSPFADLFTASFRWPRIAYTEMTDSETCLWMEYAEGVSGARLTLADLERAALELGRFQGRCARQQAVINQISCLGDTEYIRRDFAQWTPDTVEYRWLRSCDCTLPSQLKAMLMDAQAQSNQILQKLSSLPQVLCHRDYWTENIIAQSGGIIVIDWDCAGVGCIGEDIASLIADETEASQITTYYQTLVPAYCRGLSEYGKYPPREALPIREMILLKFGYRFVQQVMFAKSPQPKAEAIRALEAIYGMPRLAL